MRLEGGDVPDQTIDAVRRSLTGRISMPGSILPEDTRDLDIGLGGPRGSEELPPEREASIALPHYVFSLGMDAFGDADPLAAAEPTMVRFLVNNGRRFSATAEIPMDAMGDDEQVPDVSTGTSAAEMAEVIQSVEEADNSSETFEVRLLRAPAIQVAAVWLHHKVAEELDRFQFLGENENPEAGQVLDRPSFVSELRRRAGVWAELYATSDDEDQSLLGG